MRCHRYSRAKRDIVEIVLFIRRDSHRSALRFVDVLKAAVRRVAEMPGLGASDDFGRPELSGMRYWPVNGFRNYLIFYRCTEGTLEIIRVLHSARDIRSLFGAKLTDALHGRTVPFRSI